MAYLLDGTPKALEYLMREQRIRVERGELSFTPVDADTAAAILGKPQTDFGEADDKHITENDSKDVPAAPAKEPTARKTSSRARKAE